MEIDLNKLSKKLVLDENIDFLSEIYQSSGIKRLENINFSGEIYYNNVDELIIKGNVTGIMVLEDSLSLDNINVPIDIEINEILGQKELKSQNTLDISEILWQNIVLEVPIRITNTTSKEISGEGWELREEKEN